MGGVSRCAQGFGEFFDEERIALGFALDEVEHVFIHMGDLKLLLHQDFGIFGREGQQVDALGHFAGAGRLAGELQVFLRRVVGNGAMGDEEQNGVHLLAHRQRQPP